MKRVFLSAFSLFLVLVAIEVLIVHVHYTRAKEMHVNDPNNSIQEEIDAANNGDTIIVGIGTYNENINFLNKDITLRSTNPYDPNVVAATIIDGGGQGSVVTFDPNVNNSPELSGFTIRNGKVDQFGAGINCINSSPNIHHCIIRDNRHIEDIGGGGAGISCTQGSSPNIHDCTIIYNTSDYGNGAGIYCDDSSPTRIVTCTIRDNSAAFSQGGGIYLNNSQVYVGKCNISNNKASLRGGGIMCNGNSSLTIDNCLISYNIATVFNNVSFGGGIYCESSSLEIINCTLSDNSAISNAGGIYFYYSSSIITNCILWDNKPTEIFADSNNTSLEVTYSCIQGGYPGTGNIDNNPVFVNPDPPDPNDVDYHLLSNSPCIDSCNPNITDPCGGKDFDLDYIGRPQDGDNNGSCIFDMGAYEFCPDPDNDGICGTYDTCPNDPNNNETNADGDNFRVCDGDCDDSDPYIYPDAQELCDGKDNDCDGQTDEDFNIGVSCDGTGVCGTGVIECADLNTTRCSTDPGGSQDKSTTEICDGLDNDCDAQTDEDFNIGVACVGTGACGTGVVECADPNTTRCSTDPGGSQDKSTPELCDGLDNDCDGLVDEDFTDTDNDGIADCIDECPNDPTNECIDYSIHIEPHTMKIISFVHRPDDPSATSVFGDEVRKNYHYPKLFKIGTYNPKSSNYIEYGANLIVEPGKGYWCYARNGLYIVFNDVIPVSPNDNEIELLFDSNTNDGWNMIACPYNTNYLWDNVEVQGCDPSDPNAKTISEMAMENDCNCIDRFLLWKWENGTYVYYNPDPNSTCGNEPNEYEPDSDPYMRPNEGYWVKVKRENVYLRFPPLNMPRVKYSHNDVLIADMASQEEKSPSSSRKAITTAVSDSPPAPLGGFRPNEGGFSETGSGGCFISNMFFGLPKYTR